MVAQNPVAALPVHVLERPDMRDAIARHDFGMVFALARKWAGLSYSKIAEGCGIKPERVGTLARGEGSITSFEKIARIADAMLIPGHMLGLAPRVWESVPRGIAAAETAITPQWNGGGDVFRRDFLRSAAGVAVALGLPTLEVEAGRRRVGVDLPNAIRQRTARLRRLDNVLGGGDTYRLYLAEFQSTKEILRQGSYTEMVGRELLSILAEQAQQAGWAAFDSGDHERAVRLYEASHGAARDAGDAALMGNALAFLAYQRIGTDPLAAVELATASCEAAGDALTGSVGALLHERRGWAHAVAGDLGQAERALEAARVSLGRNTQEEQPDWSAWVDGSELDIMEGRCWTELQRPLRAVPILSRVLSGFDDAHARDKALYSSWLAESYLTAGEVEESAAVAGRVLDLSAGVASVRPRQQLSGVLTRLSEFRSNPVVAAVLDKATS